jgi:AcrR family transcriptional regulator
MLLRRWRSTLSRENKITKPSSEGSRRLTRGGVVSQALPGSRSTTDPERQLPRGRHDLPRRFIAHTQRDRLLDAMAQTVAKRGVGATVTEVCAAAGVSTRAFYEHFTDKEECFMATFDCGVRLLQGATSAAYALPGSWPSKMRRGLEVLLGLLTLEPAFANLAIVEMMAAGPLGRERIAKLLEYYQQFFADAPREPGQPRVPLTVVEAVVAGVFGLLFKYVSTQRTSELPGLLPEVTYFVLVPFIGPRAAAEATGLPSPA